VVEERSYDLPGRGRPEAPCVVVLHVLRHFQGVQNVGRRGGGAGGGGRGEEGACKGGGAGRRVGGRVGGREEGKFGLAGIVNAEDEVVGGMGGGREGGQA